MPLEGPWLCAVPRKLTCWPWFLQVRWGSHMGGWSRATGSRAGSSVGTTVPSAAFSLNPPPGQCRGTWLAVAGAPGAGAAPTPARVLPGSCQPAALHSLRPLSFATCLPLCDFFFSWEQRRWHRPSPLPPLTRKEKLGRQASGELDPRRCHGSLWIRWARGSPAGQGTRRDQALSRNCCWRHPDGCPESGLQWGLPDPDQVHSSGGGS